MVVTAAAKKIKTDDAQTKNEENVVRNKKRQLTEQSTLSLFVDDKAKDWRHYTRDDVWQSVKSTS